jgi:hypothetical protein
MLSKGKTPTVLDFKVVAVTAEQNGKLPLVVNEIMVSVTGLPAGCQVAVQLYQPDTGKSAHVAQRKVGSNGLLYVDYTSTPSYPLRGTCLRITTPQNDWVYLVRPCLYKGIWAALWALYPRNWFWRWDRRYWRYSHRRDD